jgi:hypothetical protein
MCVVYGLLRYLDGLAQARRRPVAGQSHEAADLLVGLPVDEMASAKRIPKQSRTLVSGGKVGRMQSGSHAL